MPRNRRETIDGGARFVTVRPAADARLAGRSLLAVSAVVEVVGQIVPQSFWVVALSSHLCRGLCTEPGGEQHLT